MLELIQITAALLGILGFFKVTDLDINIKKKKRLNFVGLETF